MKNSSAGLLPRRFVAWQLCSHPESGHYDKDPCSGFPAQVPAFPRSSSRITILELILWKVSDLHPNTLEGIGACLLSCSSSPAHSWRGTEDCAPCPCSLHTPTPPPFLGSVNNKYCDFTSFVWVYWSCTFSWNDPYVFTSWKREFGCGGSSLLTLCEGLVPPHSASHHFQS